MFPPFTPKKPDVLDHWYSLIPNFNTSSQTFYTSIETELKERQIPGLDISRVEFDEGGPLSQKREYLRMTRERLVFDICAAPFGTAYFFSCRFADIPATVQWWQLVFLLVCTLTAMALVINLSGIILGSVILIASFAILFYLLRNAVSMGLKDLDAFLIKSPVLCAVYERWFRKETYYREDTRLMYLDTVNAVVKAKVEETTGAGGIKLVRFNEFSPVLGDLYKTIERSGK